MDFMSLAVIMYAFILYVLVFGAFMFLVLLVMAVTTFFLCSHVIRMPRELLKKIADSR